MGSSKSLTPPRVIFTLLILQLSVDQKVFYLCGKEVLQQPDQHPIPNRTSWNSKFQHQLPVAQAMRCKDPPEGNVRRAQHVQHTSRVLEDFVAVAVAENECCERFLGHTPVHYEGGSEAHTRASS